MGREGSAFVGFSYGFYECWEVQVGIRYENEGKGGLC